MGTYILGEPLGCPMQYDPSFKVEQCLRDPLWVRVQVAPPIAANVIAVCSQLELLCRKEVAQRTEGQASQGVVSTSFETKGLMLKERLRGLLESQPSPHLTVEEYLARCGLDRMFPQTACYLRDPEVPATLPEPSCMDGYFEQMARLNQLVSLATQMSADVSNVPNHKYISHQLSVLHQSLGSFKSHKAMAALKTSIEDNFDVLKQALVRREKAEPRLSEQHGQWLLQLTSAVVTAASSLPADLTDKAAQPAYILTQLT